MARHFAVLGALITILSTAIDPFSQQILDYYNCLRPLESVGSAQTTIPITNYYGAGFFYTNGDAYAADGNMTAAVYLGLINPPANLSSTIASNCATGNCTFSMNASDTYSTAAMCSSCTDISATVQNSSAGLALNYKTASGCQVGPGGVVGSSMSVERSLSDSDAPLASIDILMTQNNDKPFAARCNLIPCVNTYIGNVSNGVLHETLVSSNTMPFIGTFNSYFTVVLPSVRRNSKDISCTPTDKSQHDTDICSTIGYTPINFYSVEEQCWPNDCVWTFGINPSGGIWDLMVTLFDNETVYDVDSNAQGVPWLVNLFNEGDTNIKRFETAWAGLADQITSVMRQKGENSTAPLAVGIALGSQTCIGIRWSWLSFPAALIVLTMIFLVITVLQISSSEVRQLWKSSSLVLLFHGLSAYNSHDTAAGQLELKIGTQHDAKKVVTKLECSGKEFDFVEASSPKAK